MATSLVNITSGWVSSEEVEESMKGVPQKGWELFNQFTKERLGDEKNWNFWDPIPKTVVKTFSDMKKCLFSDKDRKIMIDTEVLFRRLLAVSKDCDVNMRKVLSYELAAIPPSMFHDDGSMRKTNKADLAKKLEANTDAIIVLFRQNYPTSLQSAAYLIHGMAICQALNENHFKTFNDLGKVVLNRIVRLQKNSDMDPSIDVVTLVFDRYDREHSIKSTERHRRGMMDSGFNYQIQGNRDVQKYRNVLKSSSNKASLVPFICQYICDNGHDLLSAEKSVVLPGGFEDGEVVKVLNEVGVSTRGGGHSSGVACNHVIERPSKDNHSV